MSADLGFTLPSPPPATVSTFPSNFIRLSGSDNYYCPLCPHLAFNNPTLAYLHKSDHRSPNPIATIKKLFLTIKRILLK